MGTFHYPLFALFACCFVRVGPCLSPFGKVQVYIISCEGHFTFLNSPVDVQTYDDHNRVTERLVERFRKKRFSTSWDSKLGNAVAMICCALKRTFLFRPNPNRVTFSKIQHQH